MALAHAAAAQASTATPPPASAPSAAGPANQVGEIIVTAEKRSTNLQKTPISITALNGTALAQAQVNDLLDLQALVPNLKVADNGGYGQITIRGIGISSFTPGAESAVAVNLNGVYVSRPIAQLTGFFDVSAVEVLRGPQGTLYGRNATAGSINIATNQPSPVFGGYGRLTVGNYGLVRTEAAVDVPLVDDRALLRLAGFAERRDGYGVNIVTGQDIDDKRDYGLRGSLVLKPAEGVKATIVLEHFDETDHNGGYHYFGAAGLTGLPGALGAPPLFQQLGGYTTQNSYNNAAGEDPRFHLQTTALTATVDWQHGPFGLRSITGYRDQNSLIVTPIDGGAPLNSFFASGEPDHQVSQEIQAHYDPSRLHLTAGFYYFTETDSSNPAVASFSSTVTSLTLGLTPPKPAYFVDFLQLVGTIGTDAKAGYAQATYQLTDQLSLTAGVRYSSEVKTFYQQFVVDFFTPLVGYGPVPPGVRRPPRTFTSTDPRLGLQYQVTPHTLAYFTYAKGFKSGSFDTGSFPSLGYAPESVTDYEGGVKTTLFDGRLRLNISAFDYNYTNLQVLQVVGASTEITNAASAQNYGMETELTAISVPDLQVEADLTYLHARYQNYIGPDAARPLLASVNFSGNALDNAPDFTARVSAQYTWRLDRGKVVGRIEGEYSSRFYFTPANLPLEGQGAYAKGNALLTYSSGSSWQVTAFVRNMSNVLTRTSAIVQSPILGTPVNGTIAPPRTYGIAFSYQF